MTWRDQAACLDFPPELFFPHATDYADEARAICSTCPVRQQCLQEALDGDLRYGVWGGLTERQRARRYTCRRCGTPVPSFRHRYCEACAVTVRAETQARYRRSAS